LGFLWGGGWFFSIIFAGLAYAWFMRKDGSRISAADYAEITEVASQPAQPRA